MSDYRPLRIHFPAGSPFCARRNVTNNFLHAAYGSRISAVGKIFEIKVSDFGNLWARRGTCDTPCDIANIGKHVISLAYAVVMKHAMQHRQAPQLKACFLK